MAMSGDGSTVLITGGAGFIGGNFVLGLVGTGTKVMNLDTLTCPSNLDTLADVMDHPDHVFVRGDIADRALVTDLLLDCSQLVRGVAVRTPRRTGASEHRSGEATDGLSEPVEGAHHGVVQQLQGHSSGFHRRSAGNP